MKNNQELANKAAEEIDNDRRWIHMTADGQREAFSAIIPREVCEPMKKQYEELEKDKKRLDWLLEFCGLSIATLKWFTHTTAMTDRQAIDEAMKGITK